MNVVRYMTLACAIVMAAGPLGAQTSEKVAKQLAENNQALRQYSWTMRVEITEQSQKMVGLYKMRYDIDGDLQPTPLSSDAPPPEELAPGVRALARFAMSYAQPGAYAFQRFLNHAQVWEGRGEQAGTIRVEGENLHVSGDSVEITSQNQRPRVMEVSTTFEGERLMLTADYRELPQNGPSYVARIVVSYPGIEIQMENFDYMADVPAPVSKVTLPQGTQIQVRSTQPLSTKTDKFGETFTTIVEQDIVVNGKKVIAKKSRAVGRLVEVERSGRKRGLAKMSLVLTAVYLEKGPVAVQTELLTIEANPTQRKDARRIGGATGAGLLIGAIAGGAVKGAVIGAVVGTTVTLATRGDEIELPAEQLFSFRLAVPVELPAN